MTILQWWKPCQVASSKSSSQPFETCNRQTVQDSTIMVCSTLCQCSCCAVQSVQYKVLSSAKLPVEGIRPVQGVLQSILSAIQCKVSVGGIRPVQGVQYKVSAVLSSARCQCPPKPVPASSLTASMTCWSTPSIITGPDCQIDSASLQITLVQHSLH